MLLYVDVSLLCSVFMVVFVVLNGVEVYFLESVCVVMMERCCVNMMGVGKIMVICLVVWGYEIFGTNARDVGRASVLVVCFEWIIGDVDVINE